MNFTMFGLITKNTRFSVVQMKQVRTALFATDGFACPSLFRHLCSAPRTLSFKYVNAGPVLELRPSPNYFLSSSLFARRMSSVGLGRNSRLRSLLTVNDHHITNPSIRSYSDDERPQNSDHSASELKGVVLHVPNPWMWLKNKWYTYYIQTWIDESFNLEEFLVGAKQALSFLTRLIVMKDYETLRNITTPEAMEAVMQLTTPMTSEQQQGIEVLVDDISLATASVSSISKISDAYQVAVDVLCMAVKRYKTRPVLIQMTVKFKRDYSSTSVGDWCIADIHEFTVRELGFMKGGDQQPK